jgi:ribosome maturation factor RimP
LVFLIILPTFAANYCGEEHIRGPEVPCFIADCMIDAKQIEQIVTEKIQGTEIFLVQITVSTSNQVHVFLDTPKGISIDECVEISRHVEQSIDREIEDYALEVSSPGIGDPLRVIGQYLKLIEGTIEVLFLNGVKIQGVLKAVTDTNFTMVYSVKEKPLGAKRPILVEKVKTIDFTHTKSVKEIIIF